MAEPFKAKNSERKFRRSKTELSQHNQYPIYTGNTCKQEQGIAYDECFVQGFTRAHARSFNDRTAISTPKSGQRSYQDKRFPDRYVYSSFQQIADGTTHSIRQRQRLNPHNIIVQSGADEERNILRYSTHKHCLTEEQKEHIKTTRQFFLAQRLHTNSVHRNHKTSNDNSKDDSKQIERIQNQTLHVPDCHRLQNHQPLLSSLPNSTRPLFQTPLGDSVGVHNYLPTLRSSTLPTPQSQQLTSRNHQSSTPLCPHSEVPQNDRSPTLSSPLLPTPRNDLSPIPHSSLTPTIRSHPYPTPRKDQSPRLRSHLLPVPRSPLLPTPRSHLLPTFRFSPLPTPQRLLLPNTRVTNNQTFASVYPRAHWTFDSYENYPYQNRRLQNSSLNYERPLLSTNVNTQRNRDHDLANFAEDHRTREVPFDTHFSPDIINHEYNYRSTGNQGFQTRIYSCTQNVDQSHNLHNLAYRRISPNQNYTPHAPNIGRRPTYQYVNQWQHRDQFQRNLQSDDDSSQFETSFYRTGYSQECSGLSINRRERYQDGSNINQQMRSLRQQILPHVDDPWNTTCHIYQIPRRYIVDRNHNIQHYPNSFPSRMHSSGANQQTRNFHRMSDNSYFTNCTGSNQLMSPPCHRRRNDGRIPRHELPTEQYHQQYSVVRQTSSNNLSPLADRNVGCSSSVKVGQSQRRNHKYSRSTRTKANARRQTEHLQNAGSSDSSQSRVWTRVRSTPTRPTLGTLCSNSDISRTDNSNSQDSMEQGGRTSGDSVCANIRTDSSSESISEDSYLTMEADQVNEFARTQATFLDNILNGLPRRPAHESDLLENRLLLLTTLLNRGLPRFVNPIEHLINGVIPFDFFWQPQLSVDNLTKRINYLVDEMCTRRSSFLDQHVRDISNALDIIYRPGYSSVTGVCNKITNYLRGFASKVSNNSEKSKASTDSSDVLSQNIANICSTDNNDVLDSSQSECSQFPEPNERYDDNQQEDLDGENCSSVDNLHDQITMCDKPVVAMNKSLNIHSEECTNGFSDDDILEQNTVKERDAVFSSVIEQNDDCYSHESVTCNNSDVNGNINEQSIHIGTNQVESNHLPYNRMNGNNTRNHMMDCVNISNQDFQLFENSPVQYSESCFPYQLMNDNHHEESIPENSKTDHGKVTNREYLCSTKCEMPLDDYQYIDDPALLHFNSSCRGTQAQEHSRIHNHYIRLPECAIDPNSDTITALHTNRDGMSYNTVSEEIYINSFPNELDRPTVTHLQQPVDESSKAFGNTNFLVEESSQSSTSSESDIFYEGEENMYSTTHKNNNHEISRDCSREMVTCHSGTHREDLSSVGEDAAVSIPRMTNVRNNLTRSSNDHIPPSTAVDRDINYSNRGTHYSDLENVCQGYAAVGSPDATTPVRRQRPPRNFYSRRRRRFMSSQSSLFSQDNSCYQESSSEEALRVEFHPPLQNLPTNRSVQRQSRHVDIDIAPDTRELSSYSAESLAKRSSEQQSPSVHNCESFSKKDKKRWSKRKKMLKKTHRMN